MNELSRTRGKMMRLTSRELQVMSLLCAGMKDREIANTLGLSVRTVQNHLSRIYLKVRAQNRTEAISKFISTYGKFAMDLILGGSDEKNNNTLDWGQICAIVNG